MASVLSWRWRMTALPHGWHRALGAISLLWLATALGAGMTFGSQALLARELEPAGYGLFSSSLATVTMVAPLAGFGLAQFWLKVYGAEGWAANRWLRPSMRFLGGSTLLTMLLIAGWAVTGAPPDAALTLIILLPVVLGILAANLIGTKLRLEERHGALAAWQLATPGSRLVVALMLLLVPALAGRFVACGFALISLGVAALATPELRAMLRGEMRLHGHGPRPALAPSRMRDMPGVWSVWSQAWAFGLSAVLYPVFFQISTVLVKYFDGNVEAGIFGIALAVMTAIYLIPSTVFQKYLLSKQHRWAVHDPKMFWLVYRRCNVAMLLGGIVLGIIVALLAPWAIPLAFGDKYRAVVPVLSVLAWCVPIRFMSTSVGSALLNERHMRYRVFVMAFSAMLVIVMDVLLIPIHHAIGAAIATVAGEGALLAATYVGVRLFHPREHRPS